MTKEEIGKLKSEINELKGKLNSIACKEKDIEKKRKECGEIKHENAMLKQQIESLNVKLEKQIAHSQTLVKRIQELKGKSLSKSSPKIDQDAVSKLRLQMRERFGGNNGIQIS